MAASTIQFYNRIAPFYGAIDFFLKPQRKTLIREINQQKPGRLLEIGSGTGSYLTQYQGHQITAIDTSEAMLKRAQQYQNETIEFHLMAGDDLQFAAASFDYVVLSHVLAVVPQADTVLAEVARVLKQNGKVFILNHFTPHNWLRHIDKSFDVLAKTFHFKSFFALDKVQNQHGLTTVKEINIGTLSYFKLLILEKQ